MLVNLVRIAAVGLLPCLLWCAQSEDGYNTNQRILKIRELGRRNSSAIPALAVYLNDPDSDIRLEAVKAIVRIDTERSIDPLVQATRDRDPEIEILAADGLVNAYMPGYLAKAGVAGALTRSMREVKGYFSSRNDQVVAADAVIRPDVGQALSEQVAKGATIEARANAARAAGILRDRAAVPALVQGLHAKDGQMITECLIALQKIGDQSAGPGVSFLTHDLEDRVQITALETVGVLRSLPSAPDVRMALKDARNVRVQRAALEALAMLGQPEDRPTFLQYARNQDAGLRAAALEGLGRIREPQDTPLLQQAYDEPNADWRVHMAAAFALVDEGKASDEEFGPLPYLVESLEMRPRANTASAYLTELARKDDVVSVLVKMAPQVSKDQKQAFCSIFAASGNPNVVPALTTLARDIDPDVALAASNALRIVKARGTA
jgi:HEAT repeat protein